MIKGLHMRPFFILCMGQTRGNGHSLIERIVSGTVYKVSVKQC